MRLNPPITIIAIAVATFAWLSFTWRQNDCYFAPDGTKRFSNFFDAAVARVKSGPACDVWIDIAPKKPVTAIRIFADGVGGSDVIAQISPHENGFIAVIPPYPWGSEYRKIESPTVEDFRKFGKVFPILAPNPELYAKIYSLIAPFRDFQGGMFLETDTQEFRAWAGLDDPRTRRIVCRKPYEIRPARHGPLVAFEEKEKDVEFTYVSLGISCEDTAIRNASQRVEAAMEALKQASDSRAEIDWEAQRPFPYCGRLPGNDALEGPCITPIL